MRCLLCIGLLALSSCAEGRYHYAMEHAYLSPRARQLSQTDRAEILRLISQATSETVIGVGHIGSERTLNEMHVVTYHTENDVTVFDLRKENGKWRIADYGLGTPFISRSWYHY